MGLSGALWFLDRLRLLVLRNTHPQTGVQQTVAILLALLTTFWAFVIWSIANMDQPLVQLMMPMQSAWTAQEALFVWIMWAVMMGAMMLPSAAPMILVHRKIVGHKGLLSHSLVFIGAYLLVWGVFSAATTGIQWWLQWMGQLSHMLVVSSNQTAGVVLIIAGVSQWTTLKDKCLGQCRTPIGFLTTEWRSGSQGSLIMGLRHGLYCVGCCWALMVLLFVFGVMNLTAIGALTTLIAAEKLLPQGDVLAKIGGLFLTAWGVWLLVF
jgi:predicted metal-binding membrane protein